MITLEALNEFVASVNAMLSEANKGLSTGYVVEASVGKKNAKIIRTNVHKGVVTDIRSAFCFVDMSNGDILKAASWSAPAKHARGNIANGAKDLTRFGAIYLR